MNSPNKEGSSSSSKSSTSTSTSTIIVYKASKLVKFGYITKNDNVRHPVQTFLSS